MNKTPAASNCGGSFAFFRCALAFTLEPDIMKENNFDWSAL